MIALPIETPRLLLRAFTPADVAPMRAVYGDPEVMRYIPGGALTTDEAVREELARHTREQQERGFAFWAVVRREDGALIGDAGLGIFEQTGDVELGYTLARAAWGRGYGSEAAIACRSAALDDLRAERVVAVVDVRNAASRRVAERIGMRLERTVVAHGLAHYLFAAS